ncbi:MAG: hypothetical protein ACT4PZ_15060 [Panacagrimonas sp.]
MSARTPQAELQRARLAFDDAMLALDLDEQAKRALRTAARAWVKAGSFETLSKFVKPRKPSAVSRELG